MGKRGRPTTVKESNPSPAPPPPPQEINVPFSESTTKKKMGRPRKVKEPNPSPSPSPSPTPPQEIIVAFKESTTIKKRGRPRNVKEIMIEKIEHCSHYNTAGSDNSSPHKKLRKVTFDSKPQIFTLEHVTDIAAKLSDDSPNYDVVDSMSDTVLVKVDEYVVKKENAPLLKSILDKQGNIAMNCVVKTTTIRSSLLENVCGFFQKLEKKDPKTIKFCEVNSMLAEIRDFEKVKLDVKWLRERLEDIAKTLEESKDDYVLQEEVVKNNQDAERKRKEVEELEGKTRVARDELATIEARGEKLSEKLSNANAKWANFCQKSLVEGLP